MKKLVGIILAVSLVMATVACGAAESDVQTEPAPVVESETVEAPVPEVSEAEPTEAPKEEPEDTEAVEETPEVTEENAENPEDELSDLDFWMQGVPETVDGIDFTPWYNNEASFFDVVEEYADYEEPKIFVVSNRGVEMILSNEASIKERLVDKMNYKYYYYLPKKVVSSETVSDDILLAGAGEYLIPETSKIAVVGGLKLSVTGKNIPVSVKFVYEDGTEDTVTIYVTRDN